MLFLSSERRIQEYHLCLCGINPCLTVTMSEDPVKLYLQKDHVFVWNADDVERIRKEYRISGVQVGCLPRCPYQSVFLGMPVQLSMDETHLLVTKGKAVLVKNTRLTKAPTDQDRARLEKHAQEIHEQQAELVMSQRREEIVQYAEKITAGRLLKASGQHVSKRMRRKMRKGSSQPNAASASTPGEETLPVDVQAQKEAVIAEEMSRVKPPSREFTCYPVFTECPRTKTTDLEPVALDYPKTDAERLRCLVFADLWEKGHHLTCGAKFGGDFLLYSDDPLLYHAFAIVVCLEKGTSFDGHDLVLWGRLGNSVHKTVVLASLVEDQ
ncbi:tRNA-splicing endonuclease subunit Sen34 isoform X2 [Ixodes scapularis]|nr:tRNA-splicing endonuclease subunit Sen34 isoform X2 [Ixodes scapularis]